VALNTINQTKQSFFHVKLKALGNQNGLSTVMGNEMMTEIFP